MGLEVCWPVLFKSISPSGDSDLWTVYFQQKNVLFSDIILVGVAVEDYPMLKVIDVGHRAWVEGRIGWVYHGAVYLEKGAIISFE